MDDSPPVILGQLQSAPVTSSQIRPPSSQISPPSSQTSPSTANLPAPRSIQLRTQASPQVEVSAPEIIVVEEGAKTPHPRTPAPTEPPQKRRMGHTRITSPILTNTATTQTSLLGTHTLTRMTPRTPHTPFPHHIHTPTRTPMTKKYFLTDIPPAFRHEAGLVLDEMWGTVLRRYATNTHPPCPSRTPPQSDGPRTTNTAPYTPPAASANNDSLLGHYPQPFQPYPQ